MTEDEFSCLDCDQTLWAPVGEEDTTEPICGECLWKRYESLRQKIRSQESQNAEAEKKAYAMEKLYNAEHITKEREIKRLEKALSDLRSQSGEKIRSLEDALFEKQNALNDFGEHHKRLMALPNPLAGRVQELEESLSRMRTALEYYANRGSDRLNFPDVAREALKGHGEETTTGDTTHGGKRHDPHCCFDGVGNFHQGACCCVRAQHQPSCNLIQNPGLFGAICNCQKDDLEDMPTVPEKGEDKP